MNEAGRAAMAASFLATACGGGPPEPGEGTMVANLTADGAAISVSIDGGDVYVILLDAAGSLRIAVERVRGSEVTVMPMAPTDWSDYAASLMVGLNPTKTALVSGGSAYFLGAYGVTVVPLDGSPSRTLYEPLPPPLTAHANHSPGAFTVDGESVYLCERDDTTSSTNFGRFNQDGTWTLLFAGSSPIDAESCFGGAIAADTDAVYWSTTRAIRAYSKHDGTVTTVVDLGGLSDAPWLLSIGGGSVVWFDSFDLAFHAADKNGTTPALPPALGATTLLRLEGLNALAPFSMVATRDHIYWLTFFDLHRLLTASGKADLVASRPLQTGRFMGLATDGKNVYFTDADTNGDGGSGALTLRSVPQ